MTTLQFKTTINATIEVVFDLSRSIDFHLKSLSHTKEKAISGRTSGLIEFGEEVTFKGKHYGRNFTHTSKITQYDFPHHFEDFMIKGIFKYFKHQHSFKTENDKTIMEDIVIYELPFGFFGKVLNFVLVKVYLKKMLKTRNSAIKREAEFFTK